MATVTVIIKYDGVNWKVSKDPVNVCPGDTLIYKNEGKKAFDIESATSWLEGSKGSGGGGLSFDVPAGEPAGDKSYKVKIEGSEIKARVIVDPPNVCRDKERVITDPPNLKFIVLGAATGGAIGAAVGLLISMVI